MALVNEQNQHSGFQPVGFANPVLYGLGKSNLASKYFTDIHDGSATNSYTPGTDSCKFPADTLNGPGFSTVTGYDLATGWGSPKCGLINQLASPTPLPAVSISAGFEHSCAVLSDHSVRCWGYNGEGDLGNGTTGDSDSPTIATGVSAVAAISAGSLHTCALLTGGTVQCWGSNASGQLGNGTTVDSPTAVNVTGVSGAIGISAGSGHTCAVLASGSIQCWGANPCGQLGNYTTTDSSVPVTVSITNPVGVAAGVDHTCAWTGSGYVYCWGCNDLGQLGNGTTNNSPFPVIANNSLAYPVTAVSSGAYYSCALGINGSVYCWGWNNYGTLGIGTDNGVFDFNWVPTAVLGISSAASISAGDYNACAVLADGTVKCWGLNDSGELGDGSTGGIIPSPVSVSGLSQAVAVTVGSEHSCALSPGAVTCWGWNQNGQLGNGTTSDSSSPAVVTFH
jgi:alpha-tubulin suppressor-like RCC1 family protein